MRIGLKPDALVVLIGAMGTGKSTFSKNTFAPHQIVSSDFIREQLSGDFEDQTQNKAVFEILFATVEARAKAGILTVIDSTGSASVLEHAANLAKQHNRQLVALKFPHLDESDLTEERMKHRMNYIHAYHRQVERIDKTSIPKRFKVYDLPENGDGVSIDVEGTGKYELDPRNSYVIVPDLHGEYRVIQKVLEAYPDNKIVFLGDIVDRGESSYRTFNMVWELIQSGRAYGVRSNHDRKLSRWFRKWLNHESSARFLGIWDDEPVPAYGMKIAHGLERTLREFYSLPEPHMEKYAREFIEYYESLPHFLRLDREVTHYFAHAGVNESILNGHLMTSASEAAAVYKTLSDPNVLSEMVDDPNKAVTVHLGHEYISDDITYLKSKFSPNHMIVKHDIGFGKRRYADIKEWRFKVV